MKLQNNIDRRAVIRVSDLSEIFSVSRSTVYNYIDSGLLPRPFLLGVGCAGYLRTEIEALIIFIASAPSVHERKNFVRELESQRCRHVVV